MSLSLHQREEIAALLRERRQAQDIEHSQLAQHSGQTPALVRKTLRGEPHTLGPYQLLAVPLGIEMSEIETIMGGREAVASARAKVISTEPPPSFDEPLEEELEPQVPTASVLDTMELARRIHKAMERREVDMGQVATLTALPKRTVKRVLQGKEAGLSTYNAILEALLSPIAEPSTPEPTRIPSARRVISSPDTLSKRERKRLGNELRAQLSKTSMTYDQFAEHLGHDVSWLRGLLQGLVPDAKTYEDAQEAIDEILDTANAQEAAPTYAAFEVLSTRLSNALGKRDTRASVAKAVGLPTSAVTQVLRGNAKNLDRYALVGEHLELSADWMEVAWQAPTPPEPEPEPQAPSMTQEEKEQRGKELRARTKASGWSQRAVAEHMGRSLAWLTSVFRAKTKNKTAYEDVARALDELGLKEQPANQTTRDQRKETGQQLKTRLKATGTTQRAFGERIGKSTSWFAQFVRGDIVGLDALVLVTSHIEALEEEHQVTQLELRAPTPPAPIQASPEELQARGATLKTRLKELGLSQAEVARRCGKSPSWLTRILQGKSAKSAQYDMLDELLSSWQAPISAEPTIVEEDALVEEEVSVDATPHVSVPTSYNLSATLDALEHALEALSHVLSGTPALPTTSSSGVSMEPTPAR